MSISYEYDLTQGLIKAVAVGQVTPADVGDYFAKLRSERWFPAPSLTDVRDAAPDVTGHEVREIADLFRQFGTSLKDAPLAVVVDSDLSYGFVRMIGLMIDDVAVVAPFRDVESAMAWLAPHLRGAASKNH